jgi:hypothetical protein
MGRGAVLHHDAPVLSAKLLSVPKFLRSQIQVRCPLTSYSRNHQIRDIRCLLLKHFVQKSDRFTSMMTCISFEGLLTGRYVVVTRGNAKRGMEVHWVLNSYLKKFGNHRASQALPFPKR